LEHRDNSDALSFSLPITNCKGVGPKTALVLQRIDVNCVGDLLSHFPRTYLDRRSITPIASISSAGSAVVIRGEVTNVRSHRRSRRLHITQCTIKDKTGSIKAVWFNQPYLGRNLSRGTKLILSGSISDRRGLQMDNPDIEIKSENETGFLHTLGIVPVYPLTEGIGQKKMRRLIHSAISDFGIQAPENLSPSVVRKHGLVSRPEALRDIHFPRSMNAAEAARKRIAFEEFLALQLKIQSATSPDPRAGITHSSSHTLTNAMDKRLPFCLTLAQRRSINGIFERMCSSRQMNVLLQGDVGSGKTVVAVYSMLKAIESGRQAILMAPTEILAEQHILSLRELTEGVEFACALLTANRSKADKKRALELLASGQPALIVGTHALIYQKVRMPNAGLIIIDEQHRFGVNQRASLREKAVNADIMVMTATPIPRTLALTLYGSFETMLIDQYPPGRHQVETHFVGENDRESVYKFVRGEVAAGRQLFVVCPEIGDQATQEDRPVAVAKKMHAEYKRICPKVSVGLLHGRLEPEEKEHTLLRFRRNEIQILVTTTIIEVGVDVPNATGIIIENADRFGLAQLHQLRGRVGRARHKSRCFLMAEPTTPEAIKRIEIMVSTNDGFEIAEKDLLLRGPGEFIGTAQSGFPRLRVGHLIRDAALMADAREAASAILDIDPRLETKGNAALRFLVGRLPSNKVQL